MSYNLGDFKKDLEQIPEDTEISLFIDDVEYYLYHIKSNENEFILYMEDYKPVYNLGIVKNLIWRIKEEYLSNKVYIFNSGQLIGMQLLIGIQLLDNNKAILLTKNEKEEKRINKEYKIKEDKINPSYYKNNGKELIDSLKDMLTEEQYIGFLKANIIKYTIRCQNKGGAEDSKKAEWYQNKLTELLNKDVK